jgi:uncharacterized protein YcbX
MATVARLNVTPVKSTALSHPDEIVLDREGARGDHLFLFLETDGSRIRGATKASLLGIRTSYDEVSDRLTVELPDGHRIEAPASPTDGPVDVRLFDRTIRAAPVRGPIEEAVSERLARPVRLARAAPPERSGGRHRVSAISLASVEDLGRRGGVDAPPDPRRFRMLIELAGCDPYEEDTWRTLPVRIGDALVRMGDPVPRCVVTNLDPDSGRPDFPTLEVLAGYRRRGNEVLIGVYGEVEEPGRVRVGDRAAPERAGRSASR